MLVDSGATHNFVDPLLTPRMQDIIREYCVVHVPYTIVTAGQHVLKGATTGTRHRYRWWWARKKFLFQAVVVPGMGANLFSGTEALWNGL